jgi:hypothetical protein
VAMKQHGERMLCSRARALWLEVGSVPVAAQKWQAYYFCFPSMAFFRPADADAVIVIRFTGQIRRRCRQELAVYDPGHC